MLLCISKNQKCFLLISVIALICILILKPGFNLFSSKIEEVVEKIIPLWQINFKSCMKEAANIYYGDTDKFFGELSSCIKTHLKINKSRLDFFDNNVHNEKKVFLPMNENYAQNKCKWLTIGIGGSTTAEELFHAKYPNCQIYGVDPTRPGNFSKIGKVLPFGVGLKDDKITISVDIGYYEKRKESVMSFTRMLDVFVHSRLVHYLAADIEGIEMVILQELVGYGKLANENITFCQIDVELHSPTQESAAPSAKDINRVQWMLDFVGESSPYIPIFTVPYPPAHKVTFVNVENSECQKAFNVSSYFDNI